MFIKRLKTPLLIFTVNITMRARCSVHNSELGKYFNAVKVASS